MMTKLLLLHLLVFFKLRSPVPLLLILVLVYPILSFLQCTDNVRWPVGRTSGWQKNLPQLLPKGTA